MSLYGIKVSLKRQKFVKEKFQILSVSEEKIFFIINFCRFKVLRNLKEEGNEEMIVKFGILLYYLFELNLRKGF